jgi:predicted nucleotidyltransferase
VADVLAERRRERERLIELALTYVEQLSTRLAVEAAAVVGSVARGDFNVWSDVDVVVVADGLPGRAPDRNGLLLADAPARVQPVGFTRRELVDALRRDNPLAREAVGRGVVLTGKAVLQKCSLDAARQRRAASSGGRWPASTDNAGRWRRL